MVSPLLIKMKTGKIAPDLLKKLIFSNLGIERDEVMVHSCIGEDSSVIDFGDRLCVLSTDPITGASKGIGKYAVNISCNDVASNGAEPLGVMITLLLPENFTEEGIASIMKEINDAATKLNVEVLGGHTEVTTAVNQVIISCTAVGIVDRDKLVTSSGASPGDDIVLTKWAGLEGTAILATEFEEELKRSPWCGSENLSLQLISL
jgi:hydrogenase expression/formation protein HypE